MRACGFETRPNDIVSTALTSEYLRSLSTYNYRWWASTQTTLWGRYSHPGHNKCVHLEGIRGGEDAMLEPER